jgi:hypothetical protein
LGSGEHGHRLSSPERQLKQPRKSFGSKELENRGIEVPQPNKPTTLIEGIIMASNTLTTPKVSAGFDINLTFAS